MHLTATREAALVLFSETYLEARTKFLAAARASKEYPCTAQGPAGEALFTDATYFGPPDAVQLLILVSGTHGPEGYCGSAAQLLFLEDKCRERLPPSTAVLLIHALNCYGFAWDRRATVEGCDLNRNFIDFSGPLPRNAGYEELAEHFVPTDLSSEALCRAEAATEAYRAQHGEQKFSEARMSGQYTRPGGLFYGGTAPTAARRTLERIVIDFAVQDRDQVVIIDYHTGQGRYGYGELMCEQPSGLAGYHRAFDIFGPSVTSPDLGTSTSVALFGTQDEYWQRILGDRHTYVALEFGTYTNPAILRNEHWLFKFQPEASDSKIGRQIRLATKLHYYPQRLDWKEMVMWRAHQVNSQALEAFTRRTAHSEPKVARTDRSKP